MDEFQSNPCESHRKDLNDLTQPHTQTLKNSTQHDEYPEEIYQIPQQNSFHLKRPKSADWGKSFDSVQNKEIMQENDCSRILRSQPQNGPTKTNQLKQPNCYKDQHVENNQIERNFTKRVQNKEETLVRRQQFIGNQLDRIDKGLVSDINPTKFTVNSLNRNSMKYTDSQIVHKKGIYLNVNNVNKINSGFKKEIQEQLMRKPLVSNLENNQVKNFNPVIHITNNSLRSAMDYENQVYNVPQQIPGLTSNPSSFRHYSHTSQLNSQLLSSSQSRSIQNPDYQNVYNINNENHQTVLKDQTKTSAKKCMTVVGIVVLAIITFATVFSLGVVTGITRRPDFNLGLKTQKQTISQIKNDKPLDTKKKTEKTQTTKKKTDLSINPFVSNQVENGNTLVLNLSIPNMSSPITSKPAPSATEDKNEPNLSEVEYIDPIVVTPKSSTTQINDDLSIQPTKSFQPEMVPMVQPSTLRTQQPVNSIIPIVIKPVFSALFKPILPKNTTEAKINKADDTPSKIKKLFQQKSSQKKKVDQRIERPKGIIQPQSLIKSTIVNHNEDKNIQTPTLNIQNPGVNTSVFPKVISTIIPAVTPTIMPTITPSIIPTVTSTVIPTVTITNSTVNPALKSTDIPHSIGKQKTFTKQSNSKKQNNLVLVPSSFNKKNISFQVKPSNKGIKTTYQSNEVKPFMKKRHQINEQRKA